jgi:glycosyltransferase involved in cell wall biosynthesis
MKILIVTPVFPPDIGGPATYTSELIKRLPKTIKPTIVTFSSNPSVPPTSSPGVILSEPAEGVKTIRILSSDNFIKRQRQLFQAVYAQLKTHDICYVQGTLTVGASAMLACKLAKKPYILKYVGDEAWENYQSVGGKLRLEYFLGKNKNKLSVQLQKLILRNAKRVICPGNYLQGILQKYYQVEAENIPNAIEKPKNLKLTKHKNSIIFIGRLVPWKNVDHLIEACAKLTQNAEHTKNSSLAKNTNYAQGESAKLTKNTNSTQPFPKNWQLTIVGDGPEKLKLKKLARDLKLTKAVTFTGSLSKLEVWQKLAQSEYLVLPSSYEGLSHTLVEAMLTKTKIIASSIQANEAVLHLEKYGLIFPLNNVTAIADKLTGKYSPNLENSRKHASEEYTWGRHISQLLELFTTAPKK